MSARSSLSGLIVFVGFLLSAMIVFAGGKGGGGWYPPQPPTNCCAPYYHCIGNDLHMKHADCSDSKIQTCSGSCVNGACTP